MALKDIATIKAYHEERIARFGADASEALGWKACSKQPSRFLDFEQLGDFNGRSVLDIGCGHGDLIDFLSERTENFSYTGIDQAEEFLRIALQRHSKDSRARFLLGEFGSTVLPRSDFVICCGSLNYRNSDVGYLHRMIVRLFEASTIGTAISLLSKVDFPDGVLVSYTPEKVLDFCRQITPYCTLIESSKGDSFTLFLYHKEQAQEFTSIQ